VKREGKRCSRRWSLQPVGRTTVNQAVPLQPMVYHGGAGFHAAACGGDHGGAGGLAGAAARGGARLEQFSPEGWSPWNRPISGAVLEALLPVGSPRRLRSSRTASRGRDPTAQGTRVIEKEWWRSALD